MDHELGERGIEGPVRERKRFGGRLADVDAGNCAPERPPRRAPRGRRRTPRVSAHAGHELGRERARPATDIEHPLAGPDIGEVSERRREQARVPAHEVVIRLRGDIEAHGSSLGVDAPP